MEIPPLTMAETENAEVCFLLAYRAIGEITRHESFWSHFEKAEFGHARAFALFKSGRQSVSCGMDSTPGKGTMEWVRIKTGMPPDLVPAHRLDVSFESVGNDSLTLQERQNLY